ncbi:MAG: NAD(P)/FAD-dependent oxidoreductase [Candidatus Latescibacter sp.]|nr:NAD(P)/FAD-dependent oxidoreductase [Candidatus Latescibacter sp.]
MQTYDVVVIGGGPAGSMAALTAAEGGLATLMVERDPVIGSPVRCAEGVDEKGLSEFFTPRPEWVAAEIESYCLVAPDGTKVEMAAGGGKGYILERLVFDRMIAQEAAGKGAKVLTAVEAVGMSGYDGGFRTVSLSNCDRKWDVRARVVVAADGVESRAARWAGLETSVNPHDMETCAQVTLAGIDFEPNMFRMYFTNEFAPRGYAWLFPKGKGTANVGLGIAGDFALGKRPFQYLDAFLAKYFPAAAVVSRTIGGVPCTGGIKKMIADGVMVCGDAAHMANPITGGGIINGMIAGRIAGETALAALKMGDAAEAALRPYVKRCNERFGDMNRRFYRLKEGILNLPDERFNSLAHELIEIPVDKRTPVRVLMSALASQPQFLLLLARVVF